MNSLHSRNVEVLEWPGNSPDMNQVGNSWKEMKDCVSKRVAPLRSSSLTGCFKSGTTIKDLASWCRGK
jgi:transposase